MLAGNEPGWRESTTQGPGPSGRLDAARADPGASRFFNVTVVVEDPHYLNGVYVRSMQFRKGARRFPVEPPALHLAIVGPYGRLFTSS